MADASSLEGKHALITGATRGIGLAIAKGFLGEGAKVTLCGRKAEGVREAMSGMGDNAHGVVADVGRIEGIETVAQEAEQHFGPVQVLVNNAGTNPYMGPIEKAETWAWEKTLGVNLGGPFFLSQRIGTSMIANGSGSIINIASVAGLDPSPHMGIYSVSKAGLIMLTKVLAREWGRYGIRVNCICPGLIRTQLSEALWNDEKQLQAIIRRKALGRIGTPEEIVGAAVYFASDASSFTTGAVLTVDGGMA
jgi:NAD(P)-dependent dehydrogenase (short-subunit alcohol dehydrogenase family)